MANGKRKCLICMNKPAVKEHDWLCPACLKRTAVRGLALDLIQEEIELDRFTAELIEDLKAIELADSIACETV